MMSATWASVDGAGEAAARAAAGGVAAFWAKASEAGTARASITAAGNASCQRRGDRVAFIGCVVGS